MTSAPDEKIRTSVRRLNLRDRLWRTFEVMSEEQEKPLDELVNDAMAAYAQLAGYETTSNNETVSPVAVTPVSIVAVPMAATATGPVAGTAAAPVAAPGLRSPRSGPAFVPPLPGPVPVRVGRPPALPSAVERGASGPSGPHAMPPPPPPPSPLSSDSLAAGHATLNLVFDNQRYRIDKEQFIIGRGSKSSDLPIKDGNISRKHAAVIRRNGVYFIKDLGSTNGIDFKGMRIDNKRIDEGDVFHICEYELKFTYKR